MWEKVSQGEKNRRPRMGERWKERQKDRMRDRCGKKCHRERKIGGPGWERDGKR